jgi:gluconate 2-dehydrogenase gamma chain
MDQVSRRAFLAAGVAGTAWLLADPAEIQAALTHARVLAGTQARFRTLTAEQAADLEAISVRIFPSDGTPGAREAGVIHFIDRALETWAAPQKPLVLAALADLNQKVAARWTGRASFAALTPEQQDEQLKSIEQTPFFQQVRFATILGMFANPSYGGNQGEAGWKLLGFQAHGIFQPPFGYYDAEARRTGEEEG